MGTATQWTVGGIAAWILSGCCEIRGACDAGVQRVYDAAATPVRAKEFSVIVVNARDSWLNEDQVQGKLDEARDILVGRDGQGDHSCCARFDLDRLDWNRDLPDVFRGQPDYDLMRPGGQPVGAFVIVDTIASCSRPKEAGGCTVPGQFPSVIARRESGVAWAHEFGHAQSYDERACPNRDPQGFLPLLCEDAGSENVPDQRNVSPDDCRRYYRKPQNVGGVISTAEGEVCR